MMHVLKSIFVTLFVAVCALWPMAGHADLLKVQELETPKGITVWLVQDSSLPIIHVSFAFRGGSAAETPDKQGVTQLLSNMLDEGAGPYDSKAFQAALRDQAIDMSFNASRDTFSGSLETLTRHKDQAFTLLSLAMNAPHFKPDALARMQEANISRIRGNMSDPTWIAARIINELIYPQHGYRLNAGGTIETLKALNADDLRAARALRFGRDRLLVSIAGDITPAEAMTRVDAVFGNLPISTDCPMLDDVAMPQAPAMPIFFEKESAQTALMMAWPSIDRHDPDYYASVVLNYVFGGGGFSSRLMDKVRTEQGLTYGIQSYDVDMRHAERLFVSSTMAPQNVAATLRSVASIAADLRTKPITHDELKAAQDYLTGSLVMAFTSIGSLAEAALGLQIDGLSPHELDKYRAGIAAVTTADVQRVAARIFAADPVIVLAGARPQNVPVKEVKTIPNTEKPTKG